MTGNKVQSNIRFKRIVFIISSLFFTGCGNVAPNINDFYYQINLLNNIDTLKVQEELLLYVLATDDDGSDELEYIYLINDEHDLFWHLSNKQWGVVSENGSEWYGSNKLTMPDGDDFPRGTYRLMVLDKGGARTEREIFLTPLNPRDLSPFPEAAISSGNLDVRFFQDNYFLWFYNEAGVLDITLQDARSQIPVGELGLPPVVFETPKPVEPAESPETTEPTDENQEVIQTPVYTYFVGTYDGILGAGLISGPYAIGNQ